MAISQGLAKLIGYEDRFDAINNALRIYARDMHPPVIGAYQISCSDESEGEWTTSFHNEFVRSLLPELKFLNRSAFRTANLGARYELGALAIAEKHYAGAVPDGGFKLLLVKVHSHVAVVERDHELVFGDMVRYGQESAFCGALNALLNGKDTGFTRALHKTFSMGGVDRLGVLLDDSRVNPAHRPLYAAIVNTQLQAERILADIDTDECNGDTVYVVASSVTLNRQASDTELLCGVSVADRRRDCGVETVALGTDPSTYSLSSEGGRIRVSD